MPSKEPVLKTVMNKDVTIVFPFFFCLLEKRDEREEEDFFSVPVFGKHLMKTWLVQISAW